MYHHRITYKPKSQDSKTKSAFEFIATVLVFAFIGCLLAYRG